MKGIFEGHRLEKLYIYTGSERHRNFGSVDAPSALVRPSSGVSETRDVKERKRQASIRMMRKAHGPVRRPESAKAPSPVRTRSASVRSASLMRCWGRRQQLTTWSFRL